MLMECPRCVETGEQMWQPLNTNWLPHEERFGVWNNDPITVAIHADKHGLGKDWQGICKGIQSKIKTQKRLMRFANQAKLHSYQHQPVYMFGVLVPCNWQQARELDKANGNTCWADAEKLELQQIDDYDTFEDLGDDFEKVKHKLKDHKKIKVHMVYACKHNSRHKG